MENELIQDCDLLTIEEDKPLQQNMYKPLSLSMEPRVQPSALTTTSPRNDIISPRGKIKTLSSTNMFHQQTIIHRKLKTIEEALSQKNFTSNESKLWTGTVGEEGHSTHEFMHFDPDSEGGPSAVGHSPRRTDISGDMQTHEVEEETIQHVTGKNQLSDYQISNPVSVVMPPRTNIFGNISSIPIEKLQTQQVTPRKQSIHKSYNTTVDLSKESSSLLFQNPYKLQIPKKQMVGAKVQKPSSGRQTCKTQAGLFKGGMSPQRPFGYSMMAPKNDLPQFQSMQTPLKLKSRNPDKAINTNRLTHTPLLSNALYHSNNLVSHSQQISAAKPVFKRKTLFQNLNDQKPVKSAQKPTAQALFPRKGQTAISANSYAYSASTLTEKPKNSLAVLTQQTQAQAQQTKKVKRLSKFRKSKSPQAYQQRTERSPLGPAFSTSQLTNASANESEDLVMLQKYVANLEGEFAQNKEFMKVLMRKIEQDQEALKVMSDQVRMLKNNRSTLPCSSDSGTQTEYPSNSSEQVSNWTGKPSTANHSSSHCQQCTELRHTADTAQKTAHQLKIENEALKTKTAQIQRELSKLTNRVNEKSSKPRFR